MCISLYVVFLVKEPVNATKPSSLGSLGEKRFKMYKTYKAEVITFIYNLYSTIDRTTELLWDVAVVSGKFRSIFSTTFYR